MLLIGAVSLLFGISEWQFKGSVANALFPVVALIAAFFVPRAIRMQSGRRSTALEWCCVPAVLGSTLLLFTAMIQFGLGDLPSPVAYVMGARPRLLEEARSPEGVHIATAWVMPVTRQNALQVRLAVPGIPFFERVVYWNPIPIHRTGRVLRWEDARTLAILPPLASIDVTGSAFHLPLLIRLPGEWLKGG